MNHLDPSQFCGVVRGSGDQNGSMVSHPIGDSETSARSRERSARLSAAEGERIFSWLTTSYADGASTAPRDFILSLSCARVFICP
jgi:hypothetical protein